MGRGGRRNRKRKLSAEDEGNTNAKEEALTVHVTWWSETCSSRKELLDSKPLQVDDEASAVVPVRDDDDETSLTRHYYTLLATKYKWKSPTLVQSHAWPHILSRQSPGQRRKHVAFVSATASGKTLAFGLPLLIRAHYQKQHGLVLVPTRELAGQVGKNLNDWNATILSSGKMHHAATQNTVILVMHGGGASTTIHMDAIHKALSNETFLIMVSTPGRFLDVLETMEQAAINTKESPGSKLPPIKLSTICLDEADRLAIQADLSKQVDDILERVIEGRDQQQQLCLCSATLAAAARTKWDDWLQRTTHSDCVLVQIGGCTSQKHSQNGGDASVASDAAPDSEQHSPNSARSTNMFSRIPTNLTQVLHVCAEHKKPRKLITTLQGIRTDSKGKTGLGIIFFNRIKTLQFASKLLQKSHISSLELHSQLHQHERDRAMQLFASGRVPLLLATDVAARGLHVSHVKYIVNYDFPGNLEQYIHRCGRAGRNQTANAAGVVYSFFTRNFSVMAKDLVVLLKATNQHVDANLIELARDTKRHAVASNESGQAVKDAKRQRASDGELAVEEREEESAPEDEEGNDGAAMKDHPANRIVLRRAGNVSDASSDSDDEEDNESK
ncbi:hypothetical protein MPSEU_000660100 [Mayamaea pseudoterrestris]|nr:hypothetical protein MPSEU_000660100 [Mayamaea pseudoterrestris]